jgi:gluconate transporter
MGLIIVLIGIGLLLGLIIGLRLNAFISLIITAIFVGLANGMEGLKVLKSIQTGIGSTLSSIVLIIGFGIMLGKLLAESGASQQLVKTLLGVFGPKRAKYAIAVTGFMIGIALFYNTGFVILLPIIFTMAAETGLPLIYLALPMAASLSITHGYLPPHPGPTAIAGMFKANLGLTLIYGFIVAIPALIGAGIIFPEFFKNKEVSVASGIFKIEIKDDSQLPSFGISLFTALLPVLLMGLSTVAELTLPEGNQLRGMISFFGEANMAMLISILTAIVTLGKMQGFDMKTIGKYIEESVGGVAMILLIVAGGGAFKQVLTDSGIGTQIADMFKGSSMSPLFLGWLIAAMVRVTLGSATVAGLMAGGIMAPILVQTGASPELMVLSVGAGSLMFSHVNDTGFWMFKEYFGLTIKETILSWSLMETIVSILGLIGVLLLNIFI